MLYAPLLYCLVTLSWMFIADISAIASRKVCNYEMKAFTRSAVIKTVLFKLLNLFVFIIVPSFYFPLGNVLTVFVFVHLLLGFSLSLIFQVGHINEITEFIASETGDIDEDWAVHQLKTSCNFATQSRFWGFALGGLNYQIEHHLFPSICHIHYPEIRKIVHALCDEKKIPYNEFPRFRDAVASHFRLLLAMGK